MRQDKMRKRQKCIVHEDVHPDCPATTDHVHTKGFLLKDSWRSMIICC